MGRQRFRPYGIFQTQGGPTNWRVCDCYAIRRVSCLYYNTIDVSSRTHILSNQEISIELSYILVSKQTYSTIIA